MLKANTLLHNLEPIEGGHVEFDFDDSEAKTLEDHGVDTDKGNNWFIIFELVGGDANMTVDAKTVPLKGGGVPAVPGPFAKGGRPIEEGQPYLLWRGELRRLKLIAQTGQTPRFIGQKYFYNELN